MYLTYTHTYVYKYLHAYICTYVHTHIHTYIHRIHLLCCIAGSLQLYVVISRDQINKPAHTKNKVFCVCERALASINGVRPVI